METNLYLPVLATLNNEAILKWDYMQPLKELLAQGLVPLYVTGANGAAANRTIQYIQKQETIIYATFERDLLNTNFILAEILFDKWEAPETIKDAVAILGISVLDIKKDGYAYYVIGFMSTWDTTRGYSVIFYKNEIISIGDALAYDLESVYAHGGVKS